MRKLLWFGPSIVMVAFCLSGSVARADDAAGVLAKIEAARTSLKSYQVDSTGPGGQSGSTVFVRGVGSRHRMTSGSTEFVVYIVGTTAYQRINGTWNRIPLDPAVAATFAKSIVRHRSAELLPDQIEDGVAVGAIKVEATVTVPPLSAGPSEPITRTSLMVCTYDKLTLLYRTCKNDSTTRQYSHYDDPSLTIEVPAEALVAPELRLPGLQKTP